MDEFKLLKDIKSENGEEIHKWENIEIDYTYKLFYKLIDADEEQGFDFYVFEWCSQYDNNNPKILDQFDIEYTKGVCFMEGLALWDGLRHLYFGREEDKNQGYFYHTSASTVTKVMEEIKKLVIKYCREPNER